MYINKIESYYILENGEIVGFGSNVNGQLGLGEDVEGSLLPISIIIGDQDNPISIASIYCGDMHSAFITINNDLYTCGDPQHGRLCRPVTSETNSKTPHQVEDFKNTLITKVSIYLHINIYSIYTINL